MYLLDTNVVSELRRPKPHQSVLNWLSGIAADQLFLSAVTVGESQAGIEITREQDSTKAEELEVKANGSDWRSGVTSSTWGSKNFTLGVPCRGNS